MLVSSETVRGLTAGGAGYPSPARTNIIDFVTIASEGDAQDFGDLTQIRFGLQVLPLLQEEYSWVVQIPELHLDQMLLTLLPLLLQEIHRLW